MKTKNTGLLKTIQEQNFITENQILLLKHRIQKTIYEKNEEQMIEFEKFMLKQNYEISITEEQKQKGINYITKKYFTNYGYLRHNKNIKFKLEILNNLYSWFQCDYAYRKFNFKFCGFVKITNDIMTFIEPIYKLELYWLYFEKSFMYFHWNEFDYEFVNGYLKGQNILYVNGRI